MSYDPNNHTLYDYEMQVLKEKIQEFKKSPSAVNFERILVLTDKLIIYCVYRLKRNNAYLKTISNQELYHTGILGLYEAIQAMPNEEVPTKIPAWIVSYITANVKRCYGYLEKENVGIGEDIEYSPAIYYSQRVQVEYGLIKTDFFTFVQKQLITEEDANLFCSRYLDGDKIKDIAVRSKVHRQTIRIRLRNSVYKLKKIFEGEKDAYLPMRKRADELVD